MKTEVPARPRSNARCARLLIGRSLAGLLAASLVFKGVNRLAFLPLIRGIWAAALYLSPAKYITGANLRQLFTSPLIPIAVVLIALLYGCFAVLEVSLYLTGLDFSFHGRPFRLRDLFLQALRNMKNLWQPRNWPLLFLAAVLIPFTNLFLTSTFISQLTPPEYIMEVILATPLYTAGFAALFCLAAAAVLNLLFVFHFFLLRGQSFPQASKSSGALLRGRRLKTLAGVVLWNARMTLKYTLLLFLPVLLLFLLLVYLGKSNASTLIAGNYLLNNLIVPLFTFLADAAVSLAQYSYLTVLFYRGSAALAGEADPFAPTDKPQPKHLASRKPLLLIVSGLLAVTVLFGALLSILPASDLLTSLLASPVEVTSHRGYSAAAPENTLPAFQAAIDCGVAQYAELDVQMTKDGVVMVTHDTNLKRCTGRNANIYDLTYEEVRSLDAGRFFSPEFAGTKLPTLEEVIRLCKGRIKLNIEIKQNGRSPTLEAETARIILDNDFAQECVVTSLDYESLQKVKEAAPALQTGYILPLGVGNYYDLPYADFFSVETTFVTQAMVNAIHQRGKTVHVWTVDQEDDANRMIAMGVDNIITGDPPLIHTCVMRERTDIFELLTLSASDAADDWAELLGTTPAEVLQAESELAEGA